MTVVGMSRTGSRDERLVAQAIVRFVVAAIAAIVVFAAIYATFVLSEPGQRLENLGLAGAALRDDADRADSLASLSQISVLSFGAAILFVLGAALVRRRPGLGLLAVMVMVGATLLAELLKDVLARPELVEGPSWLLRNTFPSGHATVAASIGIGAILVAPNRLRWVVVPIAAVYASFIGQATQIAGWHRMSGAIGGVVLVFAVASVALVGLAGAGLVRHSATRYAHPRVKVGLLVVAAAVVFVGVVVVGMPIVFPLLQAPEGAMGAFLHIAFELFGVGLSIAVVTAFGMLVEPYSLGHPLAPRGAAPVDV